MIYMLVWNNEVIDEFDNEDEAWRMRYEYQISFGGDVTVIKRRKQ